MNVRVLLRGIALSPVLLIGAGLLMKTFVELMSTETGMATENVLTMNVAVPLERHLRAAPGDSGTLRQRPAGAAGGAGGPDGGAER